jgi:hypothetical protein
MKSGLESKSGISNYLQAREYRRAVRDAYRYVKVILICDSFSISHHSHHSSYQEEQRDRQSQAMQTLISHGEPVRHRHLVGSTCRDSRIPKPDSSWVRKFG